MPARRQPVSLPVSPGSWALMPGPLIPLQALEVKVQLFNRGGNKATKRKSAAFLKPIASAEFFAPSSCWRAARVEVAHACWKSQKSTLNSASALERA